MLKLTWKRVFHDPLIFSLFVITAILLIDLSFLGEIQTMNSTFRFLLHGATIKGSAFVLQYNVILTLITIIGLAKVFNELVESEHVSLILSNSISRTELLIKDIAGVVFLYTFYSFLTAILFGATFLLKGNELPFNFMIAIMSVPLIAIIVYNIIISFSLASSSYSITILATFVYYYMISPFVIHSQILFDAIEVDFPSVVNILNMLGYILPNASEVLTLLSDFYNGDIEFFKILKIIMSESH